MSSEWLNDDIPSEMDFHRMLREEQLQQIANLEIGQQNEPTDHETVRLKEDLDELASSLQKADWEHRFANEVEIQGLLSRLKSNLDEEEAEAETVFSQESYSFLDESLRLGPYQLTGILGEGGMGTVFAAVDTHNGFQVALKTYRRANRTSQLLQRLEREIEAVQHVESPYVVKMLDFETRRVDSYFVTELIEGHNLSSLCKAIGQLTVSDACEIVRQTALGLKALHDAGIIHRDIKPSNLMLTSAGGVKIIDFGLALIPRLAGDDLTRTGQGLGTFQFMAPEQFSDASQVDHKADIYALGATLYHLLSGEAPYRVSTNAHPTSWIQALANNPLLDIRTYRPEIPEEIATILPQLLDKDPEERTISLDQLVRRISPYAEGHHLTGLATRLPIQTTKPIPESRESSRTRQLKLKLRRAYLLMAILTVSVGVSFWALFFNHSRTGSRTTSTSFTHLAESNPSRAERPILPVNVRKSSNIISDITMKSAIEIRPTGYLPAGSLHRLEPPADYETIHPSQIVVRDFGQGVRCPLMVSRITRRRGDTSESHGLVTRIVSGQIEHLIISDQSVSGLFVSTDGKNLFAVEGPYHNHIYQYRIDSEFGLTNRTPSVSFPMENIGVRAIDDSGEHILLSSHNQKRMEFYQWGENLIPNSTVPLTGDHFHGVPRMTGNGEMIVGTLSVKAASWKPFFWTQIDGFQSIDLPLDERRVSLSAISRDGEWMAGLSGALTQQPDPYLWDREQQTIELLPKDEFEVVQIHQINATGSLILASARKSTDGYTVLLWHREGEGWKLCDLGTTRDLNDQTDRDQFQLGQTKCLSPDGQYALGTRSHAAGKERYRFAWWADLSKIDWSE